MGDGEIDLEEPESLVFFLEGKDAICDAICAQVDGWYREFDHIHWKLHSSKTP